MEYTVAELIEKLVQEFDEVTILELLQIDAVTLLSRFEDRVELYYDKLVSELSEENDEYE